MHERGEVHEERGQRPQRREVQSGYVQPVLDQRAGQQAAADSSAAAAGRGVRSRVHTQGERMEARVQGVEEWQLRRAETHRAAAFGAAEAVYRDLEDVLKDQQRLRKVGEEEGGLSKDRQRLQKLGEEGGVLTKDKQRLRKLGEEEVFSVRISRDCEKMEKSKVFSVGSLAAEAHDRCGIFSTDRPAAAAANEAYIYVGRTMYCRGQLAA